MKISFLLDRMLCILLKIGRETDAKGDSEIEESLAQGIARGELDPMTKLPLVVGGRHVRVGDV